MTRLSAFLLLCVGTQILLNGLTDVAAEAEARAACSQVGRPRALSLPIRRSPFWRSPGRGRQAALMSAFTAVRLRVEPGRTLQLALP